MVLKSGSRVPSHGCHTSIVTGVALAAGWLRWPDRPHAASAAAPSNATPPFPPLVTSRRRVANRLSSHPFTSFAPSPAGHMHTFGHHVVHTSCPPIGRRPPATSPTSGSSDRQLRAPGPGAGPRLPASPGTAGGLRV